MIELADSWYSCASGFLEFSFRQFFTFDCGLEDAKEIFEQILGEEIENGK